MNDKGDLRIVAELEEVRRRNAEGSNRVARRPLMYFDFNWNKVRISDDARRVDPSRR